MRKAKLGVILGSVALAMASFGATDAIADGKKHKGKSYSACEYEREFGPFGVRESYRCAPVKFAGGPPPWAPAHGYRNKHDRDDDDDDRRRKFKHVHKHGPQPEIVRYQPPFDLGLGRCNRELVGSVLGGATGALAGSAIGKGRGQIIAVASGAALGVLLGGQVGRSLDQADVTCVGSAFEHVPSGKTVVWRNPDSQADYRLTPTSTYELNDGRYCREYTAQATIGGRAQQVYGHACRQPDGSWQIVQH